MMQSDSMHSEFVVPWMPRLQYRAKLGNDPDSVVNVDAISPVSSTFSSSLASTAPSTPPSSERCPSPNSSLPPRRKDRQWLMASSSHHLSHNNNNAAERKPPKQRASSFFNFFSVKEPSQQALEDYQRQLGIITGASSKDGRLDTVGLPGISSAKMPPTVPKVNSKWDGIPHQLIKEKEKQKQNRNAHLHFHDYTRSLRSSGSERSGSTNTSSPALSRSSSQHHDLSSSSLTAARPLQLHNSASSTLSDLYGWEKTGNGSGSISRGGDGDGTRPGGGKKVKDRSKQKQSRKTSSYLQAPPPPLPRSIPDQYREQSLSDLGALLGPPTDHSSSPSPDLDKQSRSSSSEKGLNTPSGHSSNSVISSSASCHDDPLAPSFLSDKEESITRSRPTSIALTNSFSSPSSPSLPSSNNTTTIAITTRTTPSPPPAAEKNEMVYPSVTDQAIAPWVHPRYHPPPAASHQKQEKKSVRGVFSGK